MAEPPASNAEWFARAQRVIPGGVDSPVRSFASVGGTPYTVVAGDGPYVVDAEGNRFVDLVQSYGAVLLGHAHPVVTGAVAEAAARGTTFGAPTPGEVLLAEAVCERVPGCEQVRLVSSGTEAAMSAVRLARGATGRDRVVKFDGCYHGHSDGLLAGGGSGVAMLGLPGSAGVSVGAVADTEVVPYNVVPALDGRVACVIVEPLAANMNLVAPEPGFLEGLRAACDATGALLIFDEVISGFRLGRDEVHVGRHGLDDHARDALVQLRHHVVGHHLGVGHRARRDAGRPWQTEHGHPAAPAGQQAVGMPVVAAVELHHPVATGGAPRQADGAHGRLRPGRHQPHLLAARHTLTDGLGQQDLTRRGCAEGGAPGGGFGDGTGHHGVRVTEQDRAVRLDEVDVAVFLRVDDIGTVAGDDRVGRAAHRGKGADRRVDPSWDHTPRPREPLRVGRRRFSHRVPRPPRRRSR